METIPNDEESRKPIKVLIAGYGETTEAAPIVIIGPNGSGKTQLAQKIAAQNKVTAISAQRRTWIDDSIPVQEETQIRNHVQGQQNSWRAHSWQPTDEINQCCPA